MQLNMHTINTLQDLKGEPLSDITFVMDYLQIGFSGSVLTIYSRPIAKTAREEYRFPEAGSRDALCSFIGHVLTQVVSKPNDRIILFFDNGTIEILLDAANRVNGDAAEFWPSKGKAMIDY
jgi:hypothetical protein